jgi:hypothetical protein
MYFMATSSLVSLFRISRATPKLPAPMSLSSSYLSMAPSSGARGRTYWTARASYLSDRSDWRAEGISRRLLKLSRWGEKKGEEEEEGRERGREGFEACCWDRYELDAMDYIAE